MSLTHPLHHLPDIPDILLLHSLWVSVVIAKISHASMDLSISKTEVHGHGMPNMEVAVGLRWKPSDYLKHNKVILHYVSREEKGQAYHFLLPMTKDKLPFFIF